MATLEELVVSLVAETSGLRAELDKAAKATKAATDKMDDAIEEFSKNSSQNMSFFETAAATAIGFLGSSVVTGAIGILKDALGELKDLFVEGAGAAALEEVVLTKLANSLALTGRYSETAMEDLVAFTKAMEMQTNVSAEAIAANLSLLSSITKLDGEGLKTAQRAALDLAAAYDMDLKSATQLVGKGIEGNVAAFSRYGIAVDAGRNKTENLANIMKALSGVQGASTGSTKTLLGVWESLERSFGDMFKSVGSAIVQNQALTNVLVVLRDTFLEWGSAIDGNNLSLKQLVGQGLITTLETLAGLITILDAAARSGQFLVGVVQALITPLQAMTVPIVALFTGVDEAIKMFNKDLENTKTNLSAFGDSGDGALSDIATKLLEMRNAAEAGFNQLTDGGTKAVPSVKGATAAVEELTEAQKAQNELLKSFAMALADKGAALESQLEYEQALLESALSIQQVTQEEYFAARLGMLYEQAEQEQAQLELAYANKLITDQQYADAKTALARKQALDNKKVEDDKLKYEREVNKLKEENFKSTMANIASLSQSGNKTLAAIGKAAAITNATIDGYAAVQKALASAPPPFNFALAALVGTATAANVAKIAGVGLNKGGTIAGGGANVDTVAASLTKGETVISRDTTSKLEQFLDRALSGGAGGGTITIEISMKDDAAEFIEAKIIERQAVGQSLLVQGAS